jgi:hypothetical protein
VVRLLRYELLLHPLYDHLDHGKVHHKDHHLLTTNIMLLLSLNPVIISKNGIKIGGQVAEI